MARTIKETQTEIATSLTEKFSGLSTSATAEWRLISYIIATVLHSFELILDAFEAEMAHRTQQITIATVRWYAEISRRFQNGHELKFDNKTALFYYEYDDPNARIASIVAVNDRNQQLSIKVAKLNDKGKIEPFDSSELQNFKNYISEVHVVGSKYSIISTTPDLIRYYITVYYENSYPKTIVEQRVKDVLESFKTSITFDGILYTQRLLDAILHCKGVATVKATNMLHKGATDEDFSVVDAWCELHAGYFNYDDDSILTITSISNAQN